MKRLVSVMALILSLITGILPAFAATTEDDDLITKENLCQVSSDQLDFVRDIPIGTSRVANGDNIISYRREAVSVIFENPEDMNEILRDFEKGSHPLNGIDSTGTCRLYSSFDYATRKGVLNVDYTYISSPITGRFELVGASGTTVDSHDVLYSQTGNSEYTGTVVTQTGSSGKYSGSKQSWSIVVPNNWVAVHTGSSGGEIGCSYNVVLKRPNGSTWSYRLINNL